MFRPTLIILFLLSSCLFSTKLSIKGKGNIRLTETEFLELNSWEKDDHKAALQAFIHSCNKFAKMAQSRSIGGQITDITVSDFRDVCEIAQVVKTMNAAQAKNFFENWFKPFLVQDRAGHENGLFTGYYEATLNGSKEKDERYKYPIYARPKDLNNEPYLSRKEIEEGALKGKNLELLYVDDKVDLFFMHIQGSGKIKMKDGSTLRIGFAARNNLPFVAIANYMADQNYLSRSNLNSATVRAWLKQNPNKADEVMNVNSAYIFFRVINGEYVIGGQGVPLTPERSLAVDSDIIPYGLPIWLETKLKNPRKFDEKFNRLMIAQDTGSAIKGTVRGDVFFGNGADAEDKAFYMASKGQYFVLLPNNIFSKLK